MVPPTEISPPDVGRVPPRQRVIALFDRLVDRRLGRRFCQTADVTVTFTTGTVDRLGDRLRASAAVSDDDLALLQDLRRQFDHALEVAQARIAEEISGIKPTSRLKTVQTLVGKLKREHTMNLSQVQDVAGLRIVQEMDLAEQDNVSARIAALFEKARIVDRRSSPSFGYRAIHVVVRVEGRLVEVQVRTRLQDRWAQIVERLADYWGRQIRYGEPPDEPRRKLGPVSRLQVVELASRMSPLIRQCEEARRPAQVERRLALASDRYCGAVDRALRQLAGFDVQGTTQT